MTSPPVYRLAPTAPPAHTPLFPGEPHPSQVIPDFFPSLPMAQAKDAAPRLIRPSLESLRKYPYFVPNAHQTRAVLLVDVDKDSALLDVMDRVAQGVIPAPSWLVERGATGRAHVAWIVPRVPYGPNSRLAPQDFAQDVQQALTTELGGDPAFSWTNRTLNPWWQGWKDEGVVLWGPTAPRALGELKATLVAAGAYDPRRPHRWTPADAAGYPGRNEELFHRVRTRPASAGTPWQAVERLNAGLPEPLPAREERSIARSVERWEARTGRRQGGRAMSAQERKRQAERGAKGGAADTPAQRAARAQGPSAASVVRQAEAVGRAAQITALYEAGLTRAQIMAKTGLGRSTVYAVLRGR